MNVWPSLGAGDLLFVSKKLFLKCLLEFNIMRLCVTTSIAEFLWTRIAGLTVGANPFKLDVAKLFFGH